MSNEYTTEYWVKITMTGSVKVLAKDEDEAYDIVDAMSDEELFEIVKDVEFDVE